MELEEINFLEMSDKDKRKFVKENNGIYAKILVRDGKNGFKRADFQGELVYDSEILYSGSKYPEEFFVRSFVGEEGFVPINYENVNRFYLCRDVDIEELRKRRSENRFEDSLERSNFSVGSEVYSLI